MARPRVLGSDSLWAGEPDVRTTLKAPAIATPISKKRTRNQIIARKVLVVRLEQAQKAGLVRTGLDLSAAADFIPDAVRSAMLRHTAFADDPESVAAHLKGITEILYQGIKA